MLTINVDAEGKIISITNEDGTQLIEGTDYQTVNSVVPDVNPETPEEAEVPQEPHVDPATGETTEVQDPGETPSETTDGQSVA